MLITLDYIFKPTQSCIRENQTNKTDTSKGVSIRTPHPEIKYPTS